MLKGTTSTANITPVAAGSQPGCSRVDVRQPFLGFNFVLPDLFFYFLLSFRSGLAGLTLLLAFSSPFGTDFWRVDAPHPTAAPAKTFVLL